MTAVERAALLSKWIKPSAPDEVAQQERAQRMVTDAVSSWSALSGASKRIYAKGSYANNTNVRRDSDVDIVVECHECRYFDYADDVTPYPSSGGSYTGSWTPAAWREAVRAALVNKFGSSSVDSSGQLGSRTSIDVVPSFDYRRYLNAAGTRYYDGSCVHPKTGSKIVNWPAQQLANGRQKNDATGKRYKNFVRALKNAENALTKAGAITEKPSYLMECLVWNVANPTLCAGNLDQGFQATLVELWAGLDDEQMWRQWIEPNRLKWLFRGEKKWTVADARQVVLRTWQMLEYS